MKRFLVVLSSILCLSGYGQGPILRGPGTTNTPSAWTNVVRAIGTNSTLHSVKLTGTLPDEVFPAVLPAVDGSQLTGVAESRTNATFYGNTAFLGNFLSATMEDVTFRATNGIYFQDPVSNTETAFQQQADGNMIVNGDANFVFNIPIIGDAGGVTNIPQAGVLGLPDALDYFTNNIGGITAETATNAATTVARQNVFTNIAEMVSSPFTNRLAYVADYWGTNGGIGGGTFLWKSGTAAGTNTGTVFNSGYGGQWVRQRPNTNVWRIDWFGAYPLNPNVYSTIHDSTLAITNCFAAAGNNSVIVFPPFILATTGLSNYNIAGIEFVGDNGGSKVGGSLGGFSQMSVLTYIGPAGGVMWNVQNAHSCSWNGIGLDSGEPNYNHSTSNNAAVCLNFDKILGGLNTTDCRIENMEIRSRGTNSGTWYGLVISTNSTVNVEHFWVENVLFSGPGNIDTSATGCDSTAIYIGDSLNARAHRFQKINWAGVRYGLRSIKGGFEYEGGMATGASRDFWLDSWPAPVHIKNFYSEAATNFLTLNSGVANGLLGTSPLYVSDSAWVGGGTTNDPIVYIEGSANIIFQGVSLDANRSGNQRVFFVESSASPSLISLGNNYPVNAPDNPQLGFTNFSYVLSRGDWSTQSGKQTEWMRGLWSFSYIDPVFRTNFALFYRTATPGLEDFQFNVPPGVPLKINAESTTITGSFTNSGTSFWVTNTGGANRYLGWAGSTFYLPGGGFAGPSIADGTLTAGANRGISSDTYVVTTGGSLVGTTLQSGRFQNNLSALLARSSITTETNIQFILTGGNNIPSLAAASSNYPAMTIGGWTNDVHMRFVKSGTSTGTAAGEQVDIPVRLSAAIFYQQAAFPTNSVPPSSGSGTNFLQVSYAGLLRAVFTNYASAAEGSFCEQLGATIQPFVP